MVKPNVRVVLDEFDKITLSDLKGTSVESILGRKCKSCKLLTKKEVERFLNEEK